MENKNMKENNNTIDYSKGENWMIRQNNGDHDVDVFYLYPTVVSPKTPGNISEIDQYMKFEALKYFEKGPSCFDEFTNIFAPYYRQFADKVLFKFENGQEFIDKIDESKVKEDVFDALDYYFNHYNNGRPYILASHSQGSITMQYVISEYMKMHPDIYERMIAGYLIGFSITNRFLEENPHIKAAEGEDDTGVIITWNTEGPDSSLFSLPVLDEPQICINPLNWKTDETYAPLEMNKGSYDLKTHSIIPGVADAKIDKKRNVIICTTASEHGYHYIPAQLRLFGDKSYHINDWNFYYNNIKENALKRIEAFFKK